MKRKVILGVTGSIAAYKSLQLVTDLRKRAIDVVVIMTESAQKFITPLSFKSLSQNDVITDIFAENSVYNPLHISISNNDDLIVIAPATANTIAKIATGISNDALTCTVMASLTTKIIVPAMEGRMYNNPIVQENIKKLTNLGYRFLGPVKGRLASGKEEKGRMVEVDVIVSEIENELRIKESTIVV